MSLAKRIAACRKQAGLSQDAYAAQKVQLDRR